MQTYVYHGALTADTIAGKDFAFVDGKEYSLPENDEKVQRMHRQRALTPVQTSSQTVPANAKKGAKK